MGTQDDRVTLGPSCCLDNGRHDVPRSVAHLIVDTSGSSPAGGKRRGIVRPCCRPNRGKHGPGYSALEKADIERFFLGKSQGIGGGGLGTRGITSDDQATFPPADIWVV